MKTKTALVLIFSAIILIISCFIAQSSALLTKHGKPLIFNFKHKKMMSNSETSDFSASESFFDAANTLYSQVGLKEKDLITKLPGQPRVAFKQYGGYVTVDRKAGRAFYYYLAEADKHHANSLPLVLWLNGGPGCSSLGYGAMQELGPFWVLSDGKTLMKNEFAWNNVANVLFLESPAGVGFSYSNTTADLLRCGDKKTAKDNYVFLANWLERFPEYKKREFYIAGESYAGHFVPQLAHNILRENRKANKTIINLKGIIIGNAVINDETDLKGGFEYLGSHALISDDVATQILKFCDFSPKAVNESDKCIEADEKIDIGNINPYNIYAPLCSNPKLTDKPNNINSATSYDPCSDYYVSAYLNTPGVQKALHITNVPYHWHNCSDVVSINWRDSPYTIIPLLREIMGRGLRLWIYSGDVDAVIPVTSTQRSIEAMKIPIKKSWYPWYVNREVGGYTQVHENMTFATVRGAGHEVPMFKPKSALTLVTYFLAGAPLPKKT